MKVLMEKSEVDFNKVGKGSLVIFSNTVWVILFNQEDAKYNVASLKSDDVLREFQDVVEVKNYLRGFGDIEEILTNTEFTLKVARG